MCKHEEKICDRCGLKFECKLGDIINCQCYTVTLAEKEIKFIETKFSDCICATCMQAIKEEYNILQRPIQ